MSVECETGIHNGPDSEVPTTAEGSAQPNTGFLNPSIRKSDEASRSSLERNISRKSAGSATVHEVAPDPVEKSTPSDDDVLVVDWDGPDDPENPRK